MACTLTHGTTINVICHIFNPFPLYPLSLSLFCPLRLLGSLCFINSYSLYLCFLSLCDIFTQLFGILKNCTGPHEWDRGETERGEKAGQRSTLGAFKNLRSSACRSGHKLKKCFIWCHMQNSPTDCVKLSSGWAQFHVTSGFESALQCAFHLSKNSLI